MDLGEITRPTMLTRVESRTNKVENTVHGLFPQMNALSSDQRRQLKELGIVIREGRFSEEERDRLSTNFKRQHRRLIKKFGEHEANRLVASYLGLHGRSGKESLFHEERLRFMMKVGKNLRNRSLHSLYIKCRDTFPGLYGFKTAATLKPEQIEEIVQYSVNLRAKGQPCDYAGIAKQFKITKKHAQLILKDRLTQQGLRHKNGKFEPEEDLKLLRAMMTVLGTTDLEDLISATDVPWTTIANIMKTNRTCNQVQKRFMKLARDRLRSDIHDRAKLTPKAERWLLAKIIYFMHMKQYEHEDQIDWNLLQDKLNNDYSIRLLSLLWDEKLRFEAPDFHQLNHAELVTYLWKEKLPTLIRIHKQRYLDRLKDFYNS